MSDSDRLQTIIEIGMIHFWLMLMAINLLNTCYAFPAIKKSTSNENNVLQSPLCCINKSIEGTEWRKYCSGCQRPGPQCLCDHLPSERIGLETEVLILQHPVEFRRKTISTVPLLKLVLRHCQVLVGRSFDDHMQLESIINDALLVQGRLPLLLFPGPDAITLEDPNAMERLANAYYGGMSSEYANESQPCKYLLIIVDGTWTQAKRMLRNSPIILEKCQAIQFTGTSDISIYDSIRKQPDTYCLSTLESCERTLRLLEPSNPRMEEASHHLLESLRAMILTQMKYERMHLEKHPDLIRNVSKLQAKKERQHELLVESSSSVSQNEKEVNNKHAPYLPMGYTLRPLMESDAKYVDSRWPFRSNKSLVMIQKQILADNANATRYGRSTCLGIEFDKQLVACIIRHRNGSIGILHVDDHHRRVGLGEVLLREATGALVRRGEETFAFIVDGNKASEALFTKVGWVKVNPLGKKGTGKRKAKRLWVYSQEITYRRVKFISSFLKEC